MSRNRVTIRTIMIISKELTECNHPTFFDDNEDHSIQYKEYLENSSKEIAASNSNQEKERPPQNSDIRQLITEECCTKDCREQKHNMKDTMLELIEVYKENREVKNVVEQPTKHGTRIVESLQNFRVIHKSSISLNNTCQISSVYAIAPILSTEEPEYSLSMGYKHLNTTSETESDEIIKSGVEELVPIPSECEVTSEDKRECDVLVCENSPIFDDQSETFSYSNDDDILSDDDAFNDIEYVEASLPNFKFVSLEEENDVHQEEEEEVDLEDIFQIQDVILREKLLSINRLIANIKSLNDNPTPDRVLNSSTSFPIFEESDNLLFLSDNSSPEFKTFSDQTEETKSGSTTIHAHNSILEYDSFCFEIKPDQERLTSVVKNDISDESSNDLLLEEVNLFLTSDNSIPPGIEIFGYDSEGDIRFLKELLIDNSILFPNNESFDFEDNPSFPRPPPEPLDVEFFFDVEPNSREVISAVMNNIDELNKDECFDPGGEFNVFDEDDNFFPFMFVIRIFLPYLIYPEVFLLLLSTESEDTIFNPGISV
nr:hypothetical protein [Tanacetum cinerariifolium]